MHMDHEHHHEHDHHHHDHHHHDHHDHHHHEHTPMEELMALMKYMVGHNAAHARELADLARQLQDAGSHSAYEQVMAAVADFEQGNGRLQAVLDSLSGKE